MRCFLTAIGVGAAAVLLAGCGGGSHLALPAAPPPISNHGAQAVTIRITVPNKSVSTFARRPQYISPATQSIAIGVYDSTHTNLITTANQNITAGAPGCTTPTPLSPLTCAITLSLAPAAYTFDFKTYDGALSGGTPTGNELSANLDVPFTVLAGQANNIPVTLGGVPVAAALVPNAVAPLSGNNASGYAIIDCPTAMQVSVLGVDAGGNYILGTGAPSVSLTSSLPNSVTITPVGSAAPNAFTVSCLGAFPGSATLTATASPYVPPAGSGVGPGTIALNSAIALTASAGLANGGSFNEYGIPTASSSPVGIAAGPDGALWFTEDSGNKIGRVSTAGALTEYTIQSASGPIGIAAGPDGALWFTEYYGNKIGRVTSAGALTEYTLPTASSWPSGIAAGPDGALWFTEFLGNTIGRLTTAGALTEYAIPTASSNPYGIAAGPDGALWFTEFNPDKIGRVSTAGAFTEYTIPTASSEPLGIAAGPDGALWFIEYKGNKIGRVSTAGAFTEYAIPTGSSEPYGIAAGPDGALWFTEYNGNKIGRVTTGGAITEYTIPTASSNPDGIAAGPDGALWFTEYGGNKIGRIR